MFIASAPDRSLDWYILIDSPRNCNELTYWIVRKMICKLFRTILITWWGQDGDLFAFVDQVIGDNHPHPVNLGFDGTGARGRCYKENLLQA